MADTDTAEKTPTFSDEMQELTFKQLEGLIKKRNSLVGTINAANGDRLALTEQLTEESDDPEIVAAREARDEAVMKLDSLVRPKVEEILNSGSEGVEEATNEVKELDATLKPGLNYYKKMYGEEAAEYFPAQVRARSARIGSSATGGKRIRGFGLAVTVEGEIQHFDNFSSAAKYLDVETPLLQDKFLEAAGNPDNYKDAPDEVQFNVTFSSVDEEENEVELTADVRAYRKDAEED